ncbi:unnamed protein product [Phytophthora fragariaefolia]|uniref:RxLR effector protein n=1 Tax=Phytophthora fragariaefolia TaxID=1490495 RepID=A0A9W6Y665_9STRA|nr:unnamed protein product [Phytophthora fragariaefolia]
MRVYFDLLVAVAALVASGDASASNTAISMVIATNSLQSKTFAEPTNIPRALRSTEKVESDDVEEREWARIMGVLRTKAEAVDNWLQPRLDQRMDVRAFARKDLGIISRTGATQHENWNALVKYLRMYHRAVTGEKWSKSMAESVLLVDVITKANGF